MSAKNGNGTIPSLEALEKQVAALRGMNQELKNGIDLKSGFKGASMTNSLFSLTQSMQSVQALSPMGSFSQLAYSNIYAPLTINWTLLTYLYKTHGLLQTVIDMPVLDALRGGLELRSRDLDSDDLHKLDDRIESGGMMTAASETGIWSRLYGGGGVVINTEQDPSTPLDLRQIKPNKKLELYAASRWELSSTNRLSEYFLFYGQKIHSSRVITMAGKAAPYLVKFVLQGWGMSEYERMIDDWNLYFRTKDLVYELLKEAKIDVYQFENFTGQLATDYGTNITRRRIEFMNQLKNYMNAVVLDKNDVFEQKQLTFAGLADVQKQNQVYIASALRMPMAKLFGLPASGFSSGEDDIENYNALVESEVREPMRPILKKLLRLVCIQEFGLQAADEEFDIDFEYRPLRILGEVEEETVKTSKFNRYNTMFTSGVLNAKEFGELCHSENLIPIEPESANTGELAEVDMRGQEPGGDEEEIEVA